jgi:hypothetical protein
MAKVGCYDEKGAGGLRISAFGAQIRTTLMEGLGSGRCVRPSNGVELPGLPGASRLEALT